MARTEADRDDLYSELASFLPRWEFRVLGEPGCIVAGLRKDGRMSIFFGADPCFHFDAENRLLRSFFDGELYRTQGHTLARLQRVRTAEETVLSRSDLTQGELELFQETVSGRLKRLQQALQSGAFETLRETHDSDRDCDCGSDLEVLCSRIELVIATGVSLAPAYPTRRR